MMDLLRIRETFDVQALAQSPIAEVEFFAIASQAADPVAALAHITDEKLANPNYSTRQARSEIATQEAIQSGQGLQRAITLLRQANALMRVAIELVGTLEASPEADQIAELAHNIYEMAWEIGGRASPERTEHGV